MGPGVVLWHCSKNSEAWDKAISLMNSVLQTSVQKLPGQHYLIVQLYIDRYVYTKGSKWKTQKWWNKIEHKKSIACQEEIWGLVFSFLFAEFFYGFFWGEVRWLWSWGELVGDQFSTDSFVSVGSKSFSSVFLLPTSLLGFKGRGKRKKKSTAL